MTWVLIPVFRPHLPGLCSWGFLRNGDKRGHPHHLATLRLHRGKPWDSIPEPAQNNGFPLQALKTPNAGRRGSVRWGGPHCAQLRPPPRVNNPRSVRCEENPPFKQAPALPFRAVWPWTSYSPSLGLGFFPSTRGQHLRAILAIRGSNNQLGSLQGNWLKALQGAGPWGLLLLSPPRSPPSAGLDRK